MAWVAILNNSLWEYDNAPADPGGAQSALWAKQTAGIRTNPNGVEIYTKCRPIGSTKDSHGELNKTYWDAVDKVFWKAGRIEHLFIGLDDAATVVKT